jgi:hypothetical protein
MLTARARSPPAGSSSFAEPDGKLPACVEAARIEAQFQALRHISEPGRAGHGQAGRRAEDWLPDAQLGQGEVLDLDRDRQFGQERLVLALHRRLGRDRPSQDGERADLQPVDLETPGQEREPAPHDAGPVEPQPHAVAVRDLEVADRGVRGERAFDAANRDPRRRRREGARDEAGENALLLVRRAGPQGQAADSRDRQHQEDEKGTPEPHQKDCPMLT